MLIHLFPVWPLCLHPSSIYHRGQHPHIGNAALLHCCDCNVYSHAKQRLMWHLNWGATCYKTSAYINPCSGHIHTSVEDVGTWLLESVTEIQSSKAGWRNLVANAKDMLFALSALCPSNNSAAAPKPQWTQSEHLVGKPTDDG